MQLYDKVYIRKIICFRKVIFPASYILYIPVNYKLLPENKSFTFNVTYSLIIIPKNTRLSIIRNNTDDNYYVKFWKNNIAALIIIAVTITLSFITPSVIFNYPLFFNITSVIFPVNTEFDLTLIILTVITNSVLNPETPKAVIILTFYLTFTGNIKISFVTTTLSLTLFTFFTITLITDTVYNIIFNFGNYKKLLYTIIVF